MEKKARKRSPRGEPMLVEDPFLLDALEWAEQSLSCLREAVRRGGDADPWLGRTGPETEALTERRRRKLQNLSLNADDDHERNAA